MRYDPRQAIEKIDNRLTAIEVKLEEVISNHLVRIQNELKRVAGRPSWPVVSVITFLFSLVTLLLSVVLRK